MRSNHILLDVIEDMKLIYQYLYMSEDHKITVNNGMTDLELTMNDKGDFRCRNMNFPDLPTVPFNDSMSLSAFDSIIDQLKKQKSDFDYFETKWEEVKETALSNVALNLHNLGRL